MKFWYWIFFKITILFLFLNVIQLSDALWLHIRAVGQWTTKLHDYFDKQHRSCQNEGLCKDKTTPCGASAAFSTQGEVIM